MSARRTTAVDIRSLDPDAVRAIVVDEWAPAAARNRAAAFASAAATVIFLPIAMILEAQLDPHPTSGRFEDPGGLLAVVASVAVVAGLVFLIVRLPPRVQSRQPRETEIAFVPETARRAPAIRVGETEVPTQSITSVAMSGFQQMPDEPALWDLTLVTEEGGVEMVHSYPNEERLRKLGEALAHSAGVDLQTSSMEAVRSRTFGERLKDEVDGA
jgi:hypothetical protein